MLRLQWWLAAHQGIQAWQFSRAFAGSKGVPCLLSISRLPKKPPSGSHLGRRKSKRPSTQAPSGATTAPPVPITTVVIVVRVLRRRTMHIKAMHIKALHINAPLDSTSAPLGEASALALHLAPVRDTHYHDSSSDLIAMISPVITPSLMAVLALRGNISQLPPESHHCQQTGCQALMLLSASTSCRPLVSFCQL